MGDISSILQVIALGGFLVGFAGIALVVAAASQGRPVRGGVLLAGLGFFAGIILMVAGNGLLVVPPAQTAVVVNVLSGELEDPPRAPGTSIILPGVQQVIIYRTDQQEYTMSGESNEGAQRGNDAVEALTEDGQTVNLDITVIYRIERENANTVHLKWQNRYEDQFVRQAIRSIVRDVVATYDAVNIYGGDRTNMQQEIQTQLATAMLEEGLSLSSLRVRTIRFNEEFAASIEQKQIAEQDLERARTEAQTAQTRAEGEAQAAIEAARGEAESITIRASAEAEALRLISEQIAANPNLIQYEYIRQLADNVSLALVPSNTPFLFDADTFTNLDEGFTAPPVPEPRIVEPETTESGE
ncbi:MAG: SPFH domain-containing protein [Aggregatilineales bacterium]